MAADFLYVWPYRRRPARVSRPGGGPLTPAAVSTRGPQSGCRSPGYGAMAVLGALLVTRTLALGALAAHRRLAGAHRHPARRDLHRRRPRRLPGLGFAAGHARHWWARRCRCPGKNPCRHRAYSGQAGCNPPAYPWWEGSGDSSGWGGVRWRGVNLPGAETSGRTSRCRQMTPRRHPCDGCTSWGSTPIATGRRSTATTWNGCTG